MRLRLYRDFLQKYLEGLAAPRERLFIISDGMDVIFNDLTSIMEDSLHPAEAVSNIIIERYEALVLRRQSHVVRPSWERISRLVLLTG